MHLYHYVMTLTGVVQPLSTRADLQGMAITLQPGEANAGPVYVGGLNSLGQPTVSSSNYGVRLPPAAAGVPPPPYPLGPLIHEQRIAMGDIRVLGTTGDTVKVSYWGDTASG